MSYEQTYKEAYQKYIRGDYAAAATLIDPLIHEKPDDPNARLLRGHIYSGLQQYDIALTEYETLQGITNDPTFLEYATQGIATCQEFSESESSSYPSGNSNGFNNNSDLRADSAPQGAWSEGRSGSVTLDDDPDLDGTWTGMESGQNFNFDNVDFNDLDQDADNPEHNPFLTQTSGDMADAANPFALDPFAMGNDSFDLPGEEANPFAMNPQEWNQDAEGASPWNTQASAEADTGRSRSALRSPSFDGDDDDKTLFIVPAEAEAGESNASTNSPDMDLDWMTGAVDQDNAGMDLDFNDSQEDTFAMPSGDSQDGDFTLPSVSGINTSALKTNSGLGSSGDQGSSSKADFLNEFDDFGDFGNLADFDIADDSAPFAKAGSGLEAGSMGSNNLEPSIGSSGRSSELVDFGDSTNANLPEDNPWSNEGSRAFSQSSIGEIEPTVSVEQGFLSFLDNAPFSAKRLYASLFTGFSTALIIAIVNVVSAPSVEEEDANVVPYLVKTGWVMALAGGLSGFGATFLLGEIILRQVRLGTQDLQLQMSRVSQGDFTAQATVYSEDEVGRLSTSFNQMSRVILTTTKEAQRKAEEQEQQKDDLQRQVIRLLDDVEGAARGDLTVQAEVTADVLGAVADSFNLTIQNLREIVFQVKQAALQVNKAATDNENFARSLSSDALRQAEELAVTLNSVQVMTDSIQRVAESAGEAESVARTASATALKGGEAVEKTVAGILRIRETVAETTRKVKRLAESSQEISKIVALISAIASRTNLLALNASIEAARAGESGKGFAIVADEVRQLADRAAKASKEIEQIVLQIQSETGSVMTAMEEGTQQVIEGTKLAEQAKRSLEDIIQVSNRIDQLVRSITQDTVEQTETSRAVAQVMQSVELTAQETSQEAQRVSRSLQNLVGVARDLQTSVERFRVETSH